jgi:hypothetical protein
MPLRGFRRNIIFHPRNVKNGALHRAFRDVFSIESDTDEHGVASHPHHVVVGDVVGLAIGHADPERHEWLRLHSGLEFRGSYHDPSLSHQFGIRNDVWGNTGKRNDTAIRDGARPPRTLAQEDSGGLGA